MSRRLAIATVGYRGGSSTPALTIAVDGYRYTDVVRRGGGGLVYIDDHESMIKRIIREDDDWLLMVAMFITENENA